MKDNECPRSFILPYWTKMKGKIFLVECPTLYVVFKTTSLNNIDRTISNYTVRNNFFFGCCKKL